MSVSINIHPDNSRRWDLVRADVFGKDEGDCVNLYFDHNWIHIHYGDTASQYEFVSRLKEVIAALPNPCPTCGK